MTLPNFATSKNCRLSYLNYVQAANTIITASSAQTSLPAVNITGVSPYNDFWQSTSTTASLTIDFGAEVAINDLALAGLTMTAGDTLRHRLSSAAAGSTAGDLLDSGTFDPGVVTGYDQAFYPLATTLAPRYWRIDFSVPSMATEGFLRVGMAWAGKSLLPEIGIPVGSFTDDWLDVSEIDVAKYSGKKYTLSLPKMRAVEFGLAGLSEAEKSFIKELKRLCGISAPVLFIRDPTRNELQSEAIIGQIEKTSPITIPQAAGLYGWASRIIQNI